MARSGSACAPPQLHDRPYWYCCTIYISITMFNSDLTILYTFLHSADYLLELLIGVILLATWRKRPDRSRLFLGAFFVASVAGSLVGIARVIVGGGDWVSVPQLSPLTELVGFPVFFLLLMYIAECVLPYYFTWQRTLLALLPWILIEGLALLTNWFPLCVLLYMLFPLYAGALLICLRWAKRVSSSRRFFSLLCTLVVIMTFTYIGGHGLRLWLFDVLHEVFYLAICLLSLFLEFYDRLTYSPHAEEAEPEPENNESEPIDDKVLPEDITAELERRIRQLMEEKELWREPELTQEELAHRTYTNRTYLTRAIQHIGYSGFKDYVNRLRVEYIKQQLLRPNHDRLQDIFYDAGYCSRGAAWRNFKQIEGVSPQEFCQQNNIENID